MKDISEVTAIVWDYGTFAELAGCLAKKCKKVYYHTPCETEYRDLKVCCLGGGQEVVTRLDDPLDPQWLNEIDLWCFPDVGFTGTQRLLRSLGKVVWGSMGATDLELYRTRFLKVLEALGLEVAPYTVVKGLENLKVFLKDKTDLWVKVNRFRANMETWHHQDWAHSQQQLRTLACEFGGLESEVVFVVQEPIPNAQEIGYDGLCIDGDFPSQSYQGYEAKNELYLGSLLQADKLPDCVKEVNEAMSPVLAEYGYRNFWATEIRKVDEKFCFIDPTARQAGQTMEHQYLNCSNLPEVIWSGANGELLTPEFLAPFAAEATLHHKDGSADFRVLQIPEEARDHVKLSHFCEGDDGLYHFPPGKNDEVGVVIGLGDSVEEALEDLKDHFELLEGEPVEIRLHAFADLLEQIKEAEKDGMEFGDDALPKPEIALT